MHDEINRVFGQAAFGGSSSSLWAPTIEVKENDGNLVVSADLPGVNENDVQVEIDGNTLTLQGERRSEEETNEGGIHRSERSYGRFFRAIPLMEGVDPEKARAEFKNGVLQVTLPLTQQRQKGRQVPIQNSGTASTQQTDNKKAA